jgi:hypothetical protein
VFGLRIPGLFKIEERPDTDAVMTDIGAQIWEFVQCNKITLQNKTYVTNPGNNWQQVTYNITTTAIFRYWPTYVSSGVVYCRLLHRLHSITAWSSSEARTVAIVAMLDMLDMVAVVAVVAVVAYAHSGSFCRVV